MADKDLDTLFATYMVAVDEWKTDKTKVGAFRVAAADLMKLEKVQQRLVDAGYITVPQGTDCWSPTDKALTLIKKPKQ